MTSHLAGLGVDLDFGELESVDLRLERGPLAGLRVEGADVTIFFTPM